LSKVISVFQSLIFLSVGTCLTSSSRPLASISLIMVTSSSVTAMALAMGYCPSLCGCRRSLWTVSRLTSPASAAASFTEFNNYQYFQILRARSFKNLAASASVLINSLADAGLARPRVIFINSSLATLSLATTRQSALRQVSR
jgi:hypothetical protein